jgi:hypothetical protein
MRAACPNTFALNPASSGHGVRAQGQPDLNISFGRSFTLRERLRLPIRMEAYNAPNHTNFQAPASTLTCQARFLQQVGRLDF